MNESIGSALLFNLVLVFVIVLSSLFIGSLAYTKAFKVKNKIVEEIEKQGEHSNSPETAYKEAEDEITNWLNYGSDGNHGIGYKKNISAGQALSCPEYKGVNAINDRGDFEYCVYLIDTCNRSGGSTERDKCGVYYHVTTYMYLDVPIINLIKIPVNGDTMTFVIRNN